MKKTIFYAAVLCAFVFTLSVNGQKQESKSDKVLHFAGKSAMVVVKTTGKLSWKLAKLTGKHVIAPAAKNVAASAAKASPSVAKASAKLAGKGIKNGVKGVAKLFRRDPDETQPVKPESEHNPK